MLKKHSLKIALLLLALSSSLLSFPSCSPKIKIGYWVKTHQDAALALGIWSVYNLSESTALLDMDCKDRKQFKKKITDALNNVSTEEPAQQGYDVRQHNFHYGNSTSHGGRDGFGDWCRKYPKAARKLRGHAKALCKTGLGLLNGSYKIN
jgi:hypothetical protein